MRKIAQAHIAFLIVPGNDLGTWTFLRIFFNPLGDLAIGCTACDDRTEIVVQRWPVVGTYCRGSSHTAQEDAESPYWTPHVTQIG